MFGKVAERPQRETTPFYPRSPYAVAKVFAHWMTVQYREAYGMFAPQRDPVQPRVAAPRRDVRDPQGHARRSPRSSPARSEQALPRQPRRAARLGLRARVRRGDVADAPAGPSRTTTSSRPARCTRVREFVELAFALVGLDWEELRRDRPALLPADRGRRAVRRRVARPRAVLGWQPHDDVPRARPDHARGGPARGRARPDARRGCAAPRGTA